MIARCQFPKSSELVSKNRMQACFFERRCSFPTQSFFLFMLKLIYVEFRIRALPTLLVASVGLLAESVLECCILLPVAFAGPLLGLPGDGDNGKLRIRQKSCYRFGFAHSPFLLPGAKRQIRSLLKDSSEAVRFGACSALGGMKAIGTVSSVFVCLPAVHGVHGGRLRTAWRT